VTRHLLLGPHGEGSQGFPGCPKAGVKAKKKNRYFLNHFLKTIFMFKNLMNNYQD
jgi:hypothetical protein